MDGYGLVLGGHVLLNSSSTLLTTTQPMPIITFRLREPIWMERRVSRMFTLGTSIHTPAFN